MSNTETHTPSDPLEQDPRAERVNYAFGQMLDVADFEAEQTYHRSRLARLTKYLLGHGTLAGLGVNPPKSTDDELELRVEPGVAIDRYGRLVEIAVPQCIRLVRWFDDQGDEELKVALHNPPRTQGGKAVIADLFLSAHSCSTAKTPAFATGPFDALDAVVSSRLAEHAKLDLVLRKEGGSDPLPTPTNHWPANANANTQRQAVIGSWDDGSEHRDLNGPNPLTEHVVGHDPSAVFLARVHLPAKAPAAGEPRPRLDLARTVRTDSRNRPIIFLPGKWFGRDIDTQPLTQG